MGELYDKNQIEKNIETIDKWKREAFEHLGAMLTNPDDPYPCVPGQQSFMANNLRFGFVGDPRNKSTSEDLATILSKYGECSRETGKFASLVVIFHTPNDLLEDYSVENYRELFWSLLNELHNIDNKEWPEHISKDPMDPTWEFCFNEEPYFVFCATPSHEVRRSRHFPNFMLAFQPRWVFEEINDSTSFGRNIKKAIRKRLRKYDGVAPHPDLKWYGQEDNHEWKQYFLSDDNSSPSKCPFTYMKNKLKGFRS